MLTANCDLLSSSITASTGECTGCVPYHSDFIWLQSVRFALSSEFPAYESQI